MEKKKDVQCNKLTVYSLKQSRSLDYVNGIRYIQII